MILLNETEYVEDCLKNKTYTEKLYPTMKLIAKYYFNYGQDKGQVREKLESFLLQAEPKCNIRDYKDTIESVIRFAKDKPMIDVGSIPVTEAEIELIDSLGERMMQRVAFTLLCLAKYGNAANPQRNNWVTHEIPVIMSMANIKVNHEKQDLLLHKMYKAGLIEFNKRVDNCNSRVTYLNEDSPVALEITDFRNLGYQYHMHKGEPYFVCENCGQITKRDNPKARRKQKYCKSCAKKIKAKQTMESAMRADSRENNPKTIEKQSL